jgi:hypothetical protein
MRIKCPAMRLLKSIVSALCIVLATASCAFANNAPESLVVSSMFSLIILLAVLTSAGGGYNVLKRIAEVKYPSKTKRTIFNALEIILGFILFIVGMATRIFGVLGLSIYAIARGVKMIQWSKEAEKEGARPAHLEGANPKRLKIAGVMLIVLTLVVFSYSLLNLNDMMGSSYSSRYHNAILLTSSAQNAHTAAKAYLKDNPKAGVVTCADMEKAGYKPTPNVTCFSDMTATSGSIRMTGPEKWKLKQPVATITFSGELTRAEP